MVLRDQEVLHLDVVAGITTRGYHALLALTDPVAAAWRSDPTPGARDWAGRLARVAGCTPSTVYNRRDEWRQEYGIDIARPLQMYSDILYYGHNSIARPESITALMVAVDQEDGDEVVRLHTDWLADFERKRVEIVNPALVSRPRAMELKLPPPASPALDEFDDLPPDFDDVDLDEAGPPRPVSVVPSVAGSHAPQVRLGLAQESRTSIVLRASPPPPAPTRNKLVLRAMPSPPPPATASNVVLRAAHRSPPSPTEKKVVQRAMRSPPRPATAVRISSGRSSVGSVDATIRRQASEQYFDYRRSVLRALLASKSWTRTGINNSKGSRR